MYKKFFKKDYNLSEMIQYLQIYDIIDKIMIQNILVKNIVESDDKYKLMVCR